MCFGEEDPITQTLRSLKLELLRTKMGLKFVEIYYRNSSVLVELLSQHKTLEKCARNIFAPPLKIIATIYRYHRGKI